jgi:hypothetical protein
MKGRDRQAFAAPWSEDAAFNLIGFVLFEGGKDYAGKLEEISTDCCSFLAGAGGHSRLREAFGL